MSEPIGDLGREDSKKDNESSGGKQHKATKQSYIEKIVRALKALVEEFSRQRYEQKTDKNFDHRWRKREVFGLWFAALVGLIAIAVSSHDSDKERDVLRRQQIVMQSQLDTLRTQLRSYITVDVAAFNDFEVGKYGWTMADINNMGPTPAYNEMAMAGVHVFMGTPVGVLKSFPICEKALKAKWAITHLIGRGDRMRKLTYVPFSVDDIRQIKSGISNIYFYGRVCYVDIFKRIHRTDFCWFWQWEKTALAAASECDAGNDAS